MNDRFEGYGTWEPTIIYICRNGHRQLWEGLQYVKWRDMLGRTGALPDSHREVYPYELEVCECRGCKDELAFRARRNSDA